MQLFPSALAAPQNTNSDRSLVYYEGGPASAAALRSALDVAEQDSTVIAVACVPSSSIPGANAQAALADALAYAVRRGVAIQTDIVESEDVGLALVKYASACAATRIFFGVDRRQAEKGLGATANYLLAFSPTQVILVSA